MRLIIDLDSGVFDGHSANDELKFALGDLCERLPGDVRDWGRGNWLRDSHGNECGSVAWLASEPGDRVTAIWQLPILTYRRP